MFVFLLWSTAAETEKGYRTDKQGTLRVISSITGMVDGTVPTPFIKRRLLPDAARILARLIPASFWASLTGALGGDSWPSRASRSFIEGKLGWKQNDFPVLFTAYFLIWLSVLGFLFTCRLFVSTQFESPPWVASAISAILCVGLLGGIGLDWPEYPYDLPHAFLFILTMTGIVRRRRWFWPAFVVASYSKETAVLLIQGYALIRRDDFKTRYYWLTLGGMSIIFAAIRLWIDYRYADAPVGGDFWYPARNAELLVKSAVMYMWPTAIIAVVLVRIFRMREELPADLRWLLLLVPIMIGLAFFKGWIEERRQYYEVYPIVGLVLIQWASVELGFERLLIPRKSGPGRGPGRATPDGRKADATDAVVLSSQG